MPICFGRYDMNEDQVLDPCIRLSRKRKPLDQGSVEIWPGDRIVDIGSVLDQGPRLQPASAPVPDLIHRYGLSIPSTHTIRQKKAFEAPNQSTTRLFAANAARKRESGWIQNQVRKFLRASLRASTQLASPPHASTFACSLTGTEYDVFGLSDHSCSTARTVVIQPRDQDDEGSSLILEKLAAYLYAIEIDNHVLDKPGDTAASSASNQRDLSLSSADIEWSLATSSSSSSSSSIREYEDEFDGNSEWLSDDSDISIADMSDDSRTPSFSFELSRFCPVTRRPGLLERFGS
nr:hypothetical protein CFP56_54955 [Quercus suber]